MLNLWGWCFNVCVCSVVVDLLRVWMCGCVNVWIGCVCV